jgi:hypothetical protein
VEVDAVTFNISGLFIHHAYMKDVAGPFFDESWWCITHRWTGRRISSHFFSKKRDAIRVAKAVTAAYEIDWDIRDMDDLTEAYPMLQAWIEEIVDEEANGTVRNRGV